MLPETLECLWRWADCPAAVPILTAEDVGGLGGAECSGLSGMGVLRPAQTARHVVCEDCGEDHVMDVTPAGCGNGGGHFFAVCPRHGRIEIDRERLLQWSVDFGSVIAALMPGLGASGPMREVICGRAWDVGRVALAGQSRPLWVVRGLSWPDGRSVAETIPKGRSPVVFLLGACAFVSLPDVPSDSVFDLRAVVRLEAGAIIVDREAVDSQLRSSVPAVVAKTAKKRATRTAAIDSIKRALRVHLRAARDHAFDTENRRDKAELLPRPTESELAEQLGLGVWSVSRALNDPDDREIRVLWKMANDVHLVMQFKG